MKNLFGTMLLASIVALGGAGCTKPDQNQEPGPQNPANPEDARFIVEVTNIGSTYADVHVTPKDKAQGYFTDVLSEGDFRQAEEHGFDDYLQYVLSNVMNEGIGYEEAVEAITSYGNDDYNITTLLPGNVYYAVAVGIDGQGTSTTDVYSEKFTTNNVEASDNTFKVSVSNIGTNSAAVSIVTKNDDPYFVDIVPSGIRKELKGDKDIRNYLIESHIAAGDIDNFILTGAQQISSEELKTGWEYDVIIFGCKDGFANTDATVETFRTSDGQDPLQCSFEFACVLNNNEQSQFSFSPTDPTAVYICDAMYEEDYQMFLGMANGDKDKAGKVILEEMIDMYSGDFGTRAETLNLLATVGAYSYGVETEPDTEYRMWAVCIDQDGNPAGTFTTSEVYKTPEAVISDATVNILDYPWFDGDKLYELDPDTFKGAKGNVVVKLKVEESDDAEEWWVGIYLGDLRDRPDKTIINNLVNGLPDMHNFTEGLVIAYWGESTICAVAKDAEGNFGVPVRQYVNLTEEGASPIEQVSLQSDRMLSSSQTMTPDKKTNTVSYRIISKRNLK